LTALAVMLFLVLLLQHLLLALRVFIVHEEKCGEKFDKHHTIERNVKPTYPNLVITLITLITTILLWLVEV
jgi:succinate dehydrogenase/fumarate reductase cytochrome b subunit